MKIAVLGSINLDITITAKKIPLKGETIQGDELKHIPGGKGANQAVALSRLGAEVTMFGCVGNDSYGEKLLKSLTDEGVKTSHIDKLDNISTGIALITVAENDNTIVISSGANAKLDKTYVDKIKDKLFINEMVLLQHEIKSEVIEYVVDLCFEKGIPVLLNPAPARTVSENVMKKISYLTPNEHEAKVLFGESCEIESALKKMPEKLIITLGENGVKTCLSNGKIFSALPRKAKVLDTTGAGDTLNAAFAFAVSSGYDLKKALAFANTAASLSTEKFGAQGGMPRYDEVIKEL